MSARPPGFFRRTAPLLSDPRSLRLIRLLVAVALLAVIWAAERRAGVRQTAPRSGPVETPDRSDSPRPETGRDGDDVGAGTEASSPAGSIPATDSDGDRAPTGAEAAPAKRRTTPASPAAPDGGAPVVIDGLSLRDPTGRVIYRGRIDLAPTIERIAAGRKLRFPNDGTTFQNRENRLPRRPPGYYREWVVPTPKESGPGPQRLITGEGGEIWYTPDHYRTFRRIPTEKGIR